MLHKKSVDSFWKTLIVKRKNTVKRPGLFSFIFLLFGCSPQGLQLISYLEARQLKADSLVKRKQCDSDFSDKDDAKSCYLQEVALLVTDHCIEIRKMEPLLQEECENFVYRLVMKPTSLFPPVQGYDSSGSDSLFPGLQTGECADDDKCQKICKDIFKTRKGREECEEFSVVVVVEMEAVFEVLKNPNTDDLEDMDLRDLERLLGISWVPLEVAIHNDMSASEEKDFLAWLASDSEAANIVSDSEEDFEILRSLFGFWTSNSAIISGLNKSIDSGDTFIEVALEEGNEVALEWLHDFFGEDCDGEDKYEKCIFKRYYCELSLSGDFEEEYFYHEFFEDMLNEILENEYDDKVGNPSWWNGAGDPEADELDTWKSSPHNVCAAINTDYDD